MKIRERNDLLELLDDYECVDLYADFDNKEIRTNCGDFYFDTTIPMAEFLEFAECVREKYEQIEAEQNG